MKPRRGDGPTARISPLSPDEIAERKRVHAAQEEAEKAREHAEAARKAATIWKTATPVPDDSPYLLRKGVKPVSTLREISIDKLAAILGYRPKAKSEPLAGRVLVVPVKVADTFSTLELIDEAGRNRRSQAARRRVAVGPRSSNYPTETQAGRPCLSGKAWQPCCPRRKRADTRALGAFVQQSVSRRERDAQTVPGRDAGHSCRSGEDDRRTRSPCNRGGAIRWWAPGNPRLRTGATGEHEGLQRSGDALRPGRC